MRLGVGYAFGLILWGSLAWAEQPWYLSPGQSSFADALDLRLRAKQQRGPTCWAHGAEVIANLALFAQPVRRYTPPQPQYQPPAQPQNPSQNIWSYQPQRPQSDPAQQSPPRSQQAQPDSRNLTPATRHDPASDEPVEPARPRTRVVDSFATLDGVSDATIKEFSGGKRAVQQTMYGVHAGGMVPVVSPFRSLFVTPTDRVTPPQGVPPTQPPPGQNGMSSPPPGPGRRIFEARHLFRYHGGGAGPWDVVRYGQRAGWNNYIDWRIFRGQGSSQQRARQLIQLIIAGMEQGVRYEGFFNSVHAMAIIGARLRDNVVIVTDSAQNGRMREVSLSRGGHLDFLLAASRKGSEASQWISQVRM